MLRLFFLQRRLVQAAEHKPGALPPAGRAVGSSGLSRSRRSAGARAGRACAAEGCRGCPAPPAHPPQHRGAQYRPPSAAPAAGRGSARSWAPALQHGPRWQGCPGAATAARALCSALSPGEELELEGCGSQGWGQTRCPLHVECRGGRPADSSCSASVEPSRTEIPPPRRYPGRSAGNHGNCVCTGLRG